MDKEFIISTIVISIGALLVGFLVHALILQGAYVKLPNLYRSEAAWQAHFGYVLLGHLFLGAGLTWVYRMGRDLARPFAMQGVKFGVAMILLTKLPFYLIFLAMMPIPSDLVAQQIVYDCIGMIGIGALTAWMNRT